MLILLVIIQMELQCCFAFVFIFLTNFRFALKLYKKGKKKDVNILEKKCLWTSKLYDAVERYFWIIQDLTIGILL